MLSYGCTDTYEYVKHHGYYSLFKVHRKWLALGVQTERCARSLIKREGGMHLAETELLGTLSKDEQHGVNDVGFAAAVWTHHRGEPLPRVLVRWAMQTK